MSEPTIKADGITLVKKGTPKEVFGKEAVQRMNKRMQKVRREYILKAARSRESAKKVILTT